jgi:hypothetical protein
MVKRPSSVEQQGNQRALQQRTAIARENSLGKSAHCSPSYHMYKSSSRAKEEGFSQVSIALGKKWLPHDGSENSNASNIPTGMKKCSNLYLRVGAVE